MVIKVSMPKVKAIKVGAKDKESLALVIPADIRRGLDIKHGESFEVSTVEGKIVYERQAPFGSVWTCIPITNVEVST